MDVQYNGLPARAIAVDVTVGNTANGVMTATMPAVPGWINVLSGFDITGTGATVALGINIVTTGLATNLSLSLLVPAGALVNGPNASWNCRPSWGRAASAANVAVTVTVPAFGLGNLGASLNLYGYRIPG